MARSKSTSGSKFDSVKNQAPANAPAPIPNGKTLAETAPTSVSAEPRKFELKKSEPRATVVPINVEEEIRRRAYELYERRGYSSGHEVDDWLVAEQEVRQRYRQQIA